MRCDPIGLIGGINSYSYAADNPATAIDPRGTNPVRVKWGTKQASTILNKALPSDPAGRRAELFAAAGDDGTLRIQVGTADYLLTGVNKDLIAVRHESNIRAAYNAAVTYPLRAVRDAPDLMHATASTPIEHIIAEGLRPVTESLNAGLAPYVDNARYTYDINAASGHASEFAATMIGELAAGGALHVGVAKGPAAIARLRSNFRSRRGIFSRRGGLSIGMPAKGTPLGDWMRYLRYRRKKYAMREEPLKYSRWYSISRGGRSGGPGHRAFQDQLKAQGYQTEVGFGDRAADAAGGREIHQIGGLNKRGDPIARERYAIHDIIASDQYHGQTIFFWNKTQPPTQTPIKIYENSQFVLSSWGGLP